MARDSKSALLETVVDLIVGLQDATQSVDEAAADYLGVNLTDLRCLGLITQRPMTPGELAVAAGRTPAAITVAIDRLERAGLATREPDPADRRRILVGPSDRAERHIAEIWGPIQEDGVALLAEFTVDQLQAFAEFLRQGADLQHRHAKRLRDVDSDQRRIG
jgi:DNA-binding MarR family transcriptional regulator